MKKPSALHTVATFALTVAAFTFAAPAKPAMMHSERND